MPKPKAIREKHIFDPEHGGGRRRRDKHLPKRKFYEENSDKIGDRIGFHERIGLGRLDESPSCDLRGNPDEPAQQKHFADSQITFVHVNNNNTVDPLQNKTNGGGEATAAEANNNNDDSPFEIAKDAQDSAENFKIDPALFYNESGEAEFIVQGPQCSYDYVGHNVISAEQVNDLLSHQHLGTASALPSSGAPPNFIIIDCRFEYEFAGGHIQGAVNISSPEQLKSFLFPSKERLEELMAQRTMLIFHCEFSEKRAPFLYRCLRDTDRRCNVDVYPRLFFPEIYVMEGGYCAFWQRYKDTPLVWKPEQPQITIG